MKTIIIKLHSSINSFVMLFTVVLMALASCSSTSKTESKGQTTNNDTIQVKVQFNADTAYQYIEDQVKFGPRVPNTKAHQQAGDFLIKELGSYADTLIVQNAQLTTFDGVKLNARNIIGEFNPKATNRILLLAHWDSRPWADNDPDSSKRREPVLGANDGASGVGVLLEMARLLSQNPANIGVDILFVDAEDWGDTSSFYNTEATWALGTQYWASNMHRDNYKPQYGILLDMVGAYNARFLKEYFSMAYAPQITNIIWNMAKKSGYGEYFKNVEGDAINDDHLFINRAGIPCVDIIDQNGGNGKSGFFPYWHTTRDDMSNISRETLKAVGQTLTNLIYSY